MYRHSTILNSTRCEIQILYDVVYPRIVSTDVDVQWLLAAFGERQVMAQLGVAA